MRVGEALELFGNIPKIRRVLQTLADVGLDYLSLGQAAPTLSGGEAQRVKLAAELARPNTGRTLYILDEPTTGLHFDDIRKLLDVLNRLVDLGNTVIVVEHNLDVIKTADWVIDLGPEAGDGGRPGRRRRARRKTWPRSDGARTRRQVLAGGPGGRARTPNGRASIRTPPAAAASGDVALEAVGKDAQMPWETDGRRWHTVERVTHEGQAVPLGGRRSSTGSTSRSTSWATFGDTNWNQRTVVEIAGADEEPGLVLPRHDRHGMAVSGWSSASAGTPSSRRTLTAAARHPAAERDAGPGGLRQRAARPGGQPQGALAGGDDPGPSPERDRHAGLPPVPEGGGGVVPRRTCKRLQTKPEDVMPWKVNGERWHLGEKGFPPGKKLQWDRALLPRLLDLVREVEPNLEMRLGRARRHHAARCRASAAAGRSGGPRTADGLDCRSWARRASST